MVRSIRAIWKRMPEIWGVPSPFKLGAQNSVFWPLRNATTTLTAYVFGIKHDIDNRLSVLTTTRGFLYRLKTTWTLAHKRLQTAAIFPHLRKFCFLLHCQALQTDTSKRNSTKFCQTVDGKSRRQCAVEQLGYPPKNWGQETFTFVQFFDDLET